MERDARLTTQSATQSQRARGRARGRRTHRAFAGGYETQVEIGAALALEKPVILHTPDRKSLDTPYPCVFHYHLVVKILVSEIRNVDAILAYLSLCSKDSTVY